MPDEPRCAWACDSSLPLEHEWTELQNDYYTCPCCGKRTRVDSKGVAQRMPKPLPAIDCQGNLIDGP